MFDYTKTVIQKIKSDFNALVALFQFSTQVFYMLYLAYALIKGTGIWWINLLLLLLSIAFFVFSVLKKTGRLQDKTKNKQVKRVYLWCKRIIKLYPIGLMVYTVYATTQNVDTLSVLLTALMIVGWVLGIVFELLTYFLVSRFEMIIEGVKADCEDLPVIGNFVKKKNDAGNPATPPSKHRQWLNKKVSEKRALRKQEKEEKKAQAKLEKQRARLERKNKRKPD